MEGYGHGFGMLKAFCLLNLWSVVWQSLLTSTVRPWENWDEPSSHPKQMLSSTYIWCCAFAQQCSSSQCSANSIPFEQIQIGHFRSSPYSSKWLPSVHSHEEVAGIPALWWWWRSSKCCDRLATYPGGWVLWRGDSEIGETLWLVLELKWWLCWKIVEDCSFKMYIIK